MMIINLQDIRSDFHGFSRLTELADQAKDCFFDTVKIDFSSVGWFDANMCAPLGVVLAVIRDNVNDIGIIN